MPENTEPTDVTSPSAPSPVPSGSSSSPSSKSSGWWSRAETIFLGLMTLSSQAAFLFLVAPKWSKATDAMIESGKWLPFVLLTAPLMAIVAPLAFGRVTDAAKALVPGAKKQE